MPQSFSIDIGEIVDLLGLEVSHRDSRGASSFNVKCPFCGSTTKRFTMNINVIRGTYRCVRCNMGSGALDLYGRVRWDTPAVKGQTTKELYCKLKDELGGREPSAVPCSPAPVKRVFDDIPPASDEILNKTYTALLQLPYFRLTLAHKTNLLKRGLDLRTVTANGYASGIPAAEIVKNHPDAEKARRKYCELNLDEAVSLIPKMGRASMDQVIAGILICSDLVRQGCRLAGVPGFYQIVHGLWGFRFLEGIYIPTRNMKHQIVCLQVRLDEALHDGLRYMTVSSKDFPKGVNTRISRAHIVQPEGGIRSSTKVMITEGPLKADVAHHLYGRLGCRDIAFIAIQGVNSTRELPDLLEQLRARGVTKVTEALDMDKYTNVNVANALGSIKATVTTHGFAFSGLTWDAEYAKQKETQLAALCARYGYPWERTDNVWRNLLNLSNALYARTIEIDVYKWNSDTKGIDDYLLTELRKKQTEAAG